MKTCLAALLFGLSFALHVTAAPQLPVKGAIIVFDGRTTRQNAAAYEYATLQTGSGAFKATLYDGRSVSGMSAHILVEIPYQTGDIPALIKRIETVSGEYSKAGRQLAPRLQQLRILASRSAPVETPPLPSSPAASPSFPAEVSTTAGAAVAGSPDTRTPAPSPAAQDESTRRRNLVATVNDPTAGLDPRISAISELAMSPKPEEIDMFASAARDSLQVIRKWGIRGLGKIKAPEAVDALMTLARQATLDTADRIEIVKQIGRLASNPDETIALPALRELTSILASGDSPAALKEQTKTQLRICEENGGAWVRSHVASLSAPDAVALNQEFIAADAVREKAVALELSMRFTPEDNATLLAYAFGKTLPARPLEGILAPIKLQGRIVKLSTALASEKQNVASGNTISLLDGPRSEIIKMYEHELDALNSKVPLRIARVTLGRLAYITGKNVQNGRFRDLADSIASSPLPTYVDQQNGQQVSGPYHMAGDVIGGLVAGAAASYMNAKYQANAAEAAEIVTMLQSLSEGAKKKLGL